MTEIQGTTEQKLALLYTQQASYYNLKVSDTLICIQKP